MTRKTSVVNEKVVTAGKVPEEKVVENKITENKVLEGPELIRKAIEIVVSYPGRARASDGRPGGLIELPGGIRTIIIGDLHGNVTNLMKILEHGNNRKDLDTGKANCVILGDAVHDDRTGHMKEMDNSVEILDVLFHLICQYPGRIYYIRGNHDTFDERLRKSGIHQGVELKNTLLRIKGPEYVAEVARFFDILPVFVIGEGFVITHAGPPHGGLSKDEIINIHKYPEKYHQLLWNRVNEFQGTPSPKEYGEQDIRLCLDILGLPSDTHFIVGHNPLWNDGNTTGLWMNVIGIHNHHIIYSGSGSRAPYFTLEKGQLVARFAVNKEPEVYYYG